MKKSSAINKASDFNSRKNKEEKVASLFLDLF